VNNAEIFPLIHTTADSHEVIYGPTACGKTTLARKRIAEDRQLGIATWVIDPFTNLPEERDRADRYASTFTEARKLLKETSDHQPLSLTIEVANQVLGDADCRDLTEQVLRCDREQKVRLRLIVNELSLGSFGYSERIREAVTEGRQLVSLPARGLVMADALARP
jgi:hypothetical protein